jgi:SPOR domain
MTDIFRSNRGHNPIAELARLIAQAHPHVDGAPADNRFREETATDGYDEPTGLPLAPQLSADLNAPEQVYERDEHRHDDAYDVDDPLRAADREFQNEGPHARRLGRALVMAILSLALVGSAGVFGYRNMFGGSNLPTPIMTANNELNRIVAAASQPQTKDSGNASQVGAATPRPDEKLVSREEQPVTIEPPALPRVGAPAAPPAAGLAVPNQAMPREAIAADLPGPPRTNAVASKRVRQSDAADVTAAANRAHWAADPIAPADANTTAAVTSRVLGAGYAVQVTSERSESRAQAAFRALQARYPNQLGGRQPIIRRADLGAAGTYYRALVGPFASSEKAARMCSGLKAAGGDCLTQKN